MPKKTSSESLRKIALGLDAVTEGVACEGTALERRTVKVGTKAFVFIGATEAMLKLESSLAEASAFAEAAPEHCRVGSGGWVKLTIGQKESPAEEVVARWIVESYDLAASAKKRPVAAKRRRR